MIFLTAHDEVEYINQIFQAGASGYLLNDSTVSDLVSAIKAVEKGSIFICSSVYKVIVKGLYGSYKIRSVDLKV